MTCKISPNSGRKSRGFTIVAAIFLLVVLAALGAAILVVSTTQQVGSALDVQGARAYQAARAGIEWGLYQITPKTPGANFSACFAEQSFALPAAATTLQGFTVKVSCTATGDPGGFNGPTVYQIDAIACNQPSCPGTPTSTYIERRVRVTI